MVDLPPDRIVTADEAVRRIRNGYGVFSYMKGYRFKVVSRHKVTLHPGTPLCLDVVAAERRVNRLKDRPTVRFLSTPRCPALKAESNPL